MAIAYSLPFKSESCPHTITDSGDRINLSTDVLSRRGSVYSTDIILLFLEVQSLP